MAQRVVTSDHVDQVSVTLYRDPARGQGDMDPRWPGGYALVTETRTIAVPAGRAVLRFEGVAQGMLPETAIVTGLPRGVVEKNRDARLLSPAALIDAYLKRRVTIRRTNRKTGKVTTGEAIIESGPGGGVLLTTASGVEALATSVTRKPCRSRYLPNGSRIDASSSTSSRCGRDLCISRRLHRWTDISNKK
eukprot:gene35217-47329_t